MSVGPTVSVNINFCAYLRFLCMTFVWEYALQYATENFLDNSSCLFHRPILIFKPLPTPLWTISRTCCVLVNCTKSTAGMCWRIKEGFFRGVEGARGGPLWLHNAALTFKSPQQSRTPQYAYKQWTKLLQNLSHCLQHIYMTFGSLKTSPVQHIYIYIYIYIYIVWLLRVKG